MASSSHVGKTENSETIKKLMSLFHLLDPEDTSLLRAGKVNHDEVWERFNFIVRCSRKTADYYRSCRPYGIKGSFNYIVPRFIKSLRDCVLSHQWPQALKLVHTLCSEVKGTDSAVWKVGLACLYQDRDKNSRLVEQFVKQVHVLQTLSVVEVLLDYLLFLLRQSNTEDAKLLVQELKQNTVYVNPLTNEKRMTAHTLFYAYQGLALYAEWKLAIFRSDHEEDETEIISQLLAHGSTARIAKTLAENATEYLVTVKDLPGVWDIFISRLVEIYEYYGKAEECRDILISYRDRNPRNPNAHRYLYKFECNNGGEEHVLLQCLQDIIKLDPCNPLCLNLYHLKELHDPAAVSILFDYLDYAHCSGQAEVWTVLADRLRNIDSPHLEEAVKNCWTSRRDWWPTMIFRDLDPDYHSTTQSEHSSLLESKQIVQNALLYLDKSKNSRKRSNDKSETDIEPTEVEIELHTERRGALLKTILEEDRDTIGRAA